MYTSALIFTENLVTPEELTAFLNCNYAIELKRKAMEPTELVTAQDFRDVRDFLLFKLIHTNAQRPKAIRSVTESIVEDAVPAGKGWANLLVSS